MSEVTFKSAVKSRYGKYTWAYMGMEGENCGTGERHCPMVENQNRVDIYVPSEDYKGWFANDPRDRFDGVRDRSPEAIQQDIYNRTFVWALTRNKTLEEARRVSMCNAWIEPNQLKGFAVVSVVDHDTV